MPTPLKVLCPECGARAHVKKTNRKHIHFNDLYCCCSDAECGYSFVMNLTFSHALSPSAKTDGRRIKDLIDAISPAEREKAIELLTAVRHQQVFTEKR
ncbi:TPA: ogr/Delta-like zinc finger family protein [Yersinia enterocolitica]|nr:ogr/Delta-like zinc finger family protein [Yersinia enterocolitica]